MDENEIFFLFTSEKEKQTLYYQQQRYMSFKNMLPDVGVLI